VKRKIRVLLSKKVELGKVDKVIIDVLARNTMDQAMDTIARFETFSIHERGYIPLARYLDQYFIYKASVNYEDCEVYVLVGLCYPEESECMLKIYVFKFECCSD